MNLVINFTISIILSIIDLYLIDFYLKNTLNNYIKQINNITKKIIYIFSFLLLLSSYIEIKSYPITICIYYIIINLMLFKYSTNFKNKIQTTTILILFNLVIHISIISFFTWIFNIPISNYYFNYFISYKTFVKLIEKYLFWICLIKYFNVMSKRNFHYFKMLTIILIIYLLMVVIVGNKELFYFPGIGRTFVFVMIVSIASLIFFDRYQVKHEIIEREQAITTQNILKEKEYLNKYNDSIDEIRTMRHDMHNTLHIIHGYLEAEQTSEATEYVSHLLGIMNNSSALVHVGIPCIDSVFDDKLKMMNKKNIKYTEHIAHVNIGCIERNSLAILIGLALDNAIEAAEKVEHNRFIKVEMKNSQQYLILRITNSIILGTRPNFYKTSKLTDSMNHGFGVKEIKHIASQYNGDVKYKTNDDNVILKVILNISEKEDQS